MNKQITTLYNHFKNTPKKLKIICDWDEVIQSAWPYSSYLAMLEEEEKNRPFGIKYKQIDFPTYFNNYWQTGKSKHGIRNPSDIYHQMPFLTVAEDLLKLIKEDKVEKLIFLSTSDDRKIEVFRETFQKFDKIINKEWGEVIHKISLRLLSDEYQYETKQAWIRDNAPGFDLFIDDNPETCKSVLNEFISFGLCRNCRKKRWELTDCENKKKFNGCPKCPTEITAVLAPYYPATENQHDERVLFVKQEVSNLKKEDFNNKYE